MRILVLAIAIVIALAIAASAAAAAPPRAEAATPAKGPFAGRVAIGGGRRLYMECRGAGSPVVVLDAGLRSRSDFWKVRQPGTPTPTVFPGVARFTRVCIYDRPGTTLGADEFSRSYPVRMPRTAKDAVADLHRLLAAARLPGPYVLGGHSTGGLIVRLYAGTYPDQVAGLVLVDALSEYLQRPLTPAQMTEYNRLNNGPIPMVRYGDLEQILFQPSFRQMRLAAARNPPRDIPLQVISRRLPQDLPAGLPEGLTTPVVERAWRASQDDLARLPGAHHVIARRSSHYIMFSQPGLIIRAVRDVVVDVRRGSER